MMVMMVKNSISINLVDYWNIDEIIELYKAGGWWKDSYDSSKIPRLITGSFVFVVAVEKETNKAIGMGRVISDGISDGYVQDVVVLPSYRNKGIGKLIIQTLISYCNSKGIEWLALISEPGKSDFYNPLGFKKMKNYVPMKYGHVI